MSIFRGLKKTFDRLSVAVYKWFAPPPCKRYSHIVSLGYNCEIAYQLYRFHGFVDSHLFNWCAVLGSESLLSALNSLDSVGVNFAPYPKAKMWKDTQHSIFFHGRGKHDIWDSEDSSLLEEDRKELVSRLGYLKEKFKRLGLSQEPVLFVYKPAETELADECKALKSFVEIRNALTCLGMKNFDLMIIVTDAYYSAIMSRFETLESNDNIVIEHVAYHAPTSHVTGGPCDARNWQRIFSLYALSQKIKPKSKKYKFEHN